MKKITVYWLKAESVRKKEEYLLSLLPKNRVDKAKRFVKDDDRFLSLAAGYLALKYVGDYAVDENGKPRSKDVFFSLSHSHGVAALALCPFGEVGLDVEKAVDGKDNDTLARYCLDEKEMEEFRNGRDFLSLFTAKESLAKAEGTGLKRDINRIPALPIDGETAYQGKKYYRHALQKDGYFVSVTAEGEDFYINVEKTYVE